MQDAPAVLQEAAPFQSELNAARQPDQQSRAEFRLDALDVAAEGGLHDAEVPGRARDAAELGDPHKGPDAAKIHGALPVWRAALCLFECGRLRPVNWLRSA